MQRPVIRCGFYLTKPIHRFGCTGLHSVILPIQALSLLYSIPAYNNCMYRYVAWHNTHMHDTQHGSVHLPFSTRYCRFYTYSHSVDVMK